MIKIDLSNTLEPLFVNREFTEFIFLSELIDGSSKELHVLISEHPDPLLPNVYNLAFGPLGDDGEIDDQAIISHKNVNIVFSSILFYAYTFLLANEGEPFSMGVDGSNETRAYLYHRMFSYNQHELADVFYIVGVDWYVRLLRNGNDIERDEQGFPYFKPRPEPFDIARKPADMYRYYMFSLNR
ncbi:hypothetical protein SAMN05216436_1303 [bacterium A37T11]|nr:hypothetical protein SAMN05216436_1303 [bacterium A37T11]